MFDNMFGVAGSDEPTEKSSAESAASGLHQTADSW